MTVLTRPQAEVAPATLWQPPEAAGAKGAPPEAAPAPRKHRTPAKRDPATAKKSTDALEAEVFGNEPTPTVRRPPADDDDREERDARRDLGRLVAVARGATADVVDVVLARVDPLKAEERQQRFVKGTAELPAAHSQSHVSDTVDLNHRCSPWGSGGRVSETEWSSRRVYAWCPPGSGKILQAA